MFEAPTPAARPGSRDPGPEPKMVLMVVSLLWMLLLSVLVLLVLL